MQIKTKAYLDWYYLGDHEEAEDDAEQTIGNCVAQYDGTDMLIIYNGTRDELAKRLVEIDFYDDKEANEFKERFKEIK